MAEQYSCPHPRFRCSNSRVCCVCDPSQWTPSDYCNGCQAVEVVVPALAIHTDEQLPSAVITTSHSPSRRLPSRTRDTYSEPYFEDPFLTDFLYPREPPDHLVPLLSASAPNVPGPDLPEPPVESPLLLKLKKVAEDASILLELFSQTLPTTEESINAEHKQIIASAAESILTLETGIRLISARQSEPIGSLREIVLDMEATKVDASCIICYAQIADTVFMPCKHLGLCGGCCREMGIREKNTGPRVVKCPICRVGIVESIRIFRA